VCSPTSKNPAIDFRVTLSANHNKARAGRTGVPESPPIISWIKKGRAALSRAVPWLGTVAYLRVVLCSNSISVLEERIGRLKTPSCIERYRAPWRLGGASGPHPLLAVPGDSLLLDTQVYTRFRPNQGVASSTQPRCPYLGTSLTTPLVSAIRLFPIF
jgi:hypothetical protein